MRKYTEVAKNSKKTRYVGARWSFKITEFVNNRKAICDFLLVTGNLGCISHGFGAIATYCWK